MAVRGRDDLVTFIELNPTSARLLERAGEYPDPTGRALIEATAAELGQPLTSIFISGGNEILGQLRQAFLHSPDLEHATVVLEQTYTIAGIDLQLFDMGQRLRHDGISTDPLVT